MVDFWLDEVVFPVEAKCFPQKIASTAWDLCTSDHVTTGFSGTDDTRLLLPLSIQQINLPSLACTNGIVLRNLLQKARWNEIGVYSKLEVSIAHSNGQEQNATIMYSKFSSAKSKVSKMGALSDLF